MRTILLAALSMVAAACTTYADGVRSYWPRPNVLVVSGAGNGFTEAQDVSNFVYLQAAEKALASNYYFFVLADETNTSTTSTGYVNMPRTTTYNAYNYGNYFSGTATTTGGPMAYPVFKPGLDAVFLMFENEPEGYRAGQYYDAVFVYNTLGPKYLGDKYQYKLAPTRTRN